VIVARRLAADWLREGQAAQLLGLLDRDGEEARVVGGAVRNALLGEPIGDVDIATTALPAVVVERASQAGFKTAPTGIDHGTVTVVVAGHPYEVTTLREDIETFGRKAKVVFGRDWRRDAERRDFTMNALSLARDGAIHDHVGGLDDLDARRVRFIGDPARRIAEDYLRILRFFRFHAAYGHGELDSAGLHACIVARAGLGQLSRERLRMEIVKLLAAGRALPALTVMAETGLLGTVLGGVPQLASLGRLIEIEAALGMSADPVRRLGALAILVREDAERLRERLRLANVEYDRLAAMAEGWLRLGAGEAAGRALLYRLGPQRFVDRVLLDWSRAPGRLRSAEWRELATLPARWSAPKFPIRAADLIDRGIARGPGLGDAMRVAEAAWINQGFPSDRAAVAGIADAAARPDPTGRPVPPRAGRDRESGGS
jgi:poly(A) polymerase